jgi:hypothetical protein
VPYRALVELIKQSTGTWDELTQECLETVAVELQMLTVKLVKEQFGSYPAAAGLIR